MARKYREIPIALHTEILTRFLGEPGLRELHERYNEAKKTQNSRAEPSDNDRRIASLSRTMSSLQVANKLGISKTKVDGAIRRVAMYEYYASPDEK